MAWDDNQHIDTQINFAVRRLNMDTSEHTRFEFKRLQVWFLLQPVSNTFPNLDHMMFRKKAELQYMAIYYIHSSTII